MAKKSLSKIFCLVGSYGCFAVAFCQLLFMNLNKNVVYFLITDHNPTVMAYRHQPLSIDWVDSKGRNKPMTTTVGPHVTQEASTSNGKTDTN